jgi:hypothetical protein
MSRATTDTTSVGQRIVELLGEVDGAVVDRWAVIDALLDLRQAAGDDALVVHWVEELLRVLPGRNLVAAEWWRSALEQLLDATRA